jgi:serine/threonine-protein kinase
MRNATAESLHDRLTRLQRLAPHEAVKIGAALARSVVQLHRQGLKDCPITPANIMLAGDEARLIEAEQAMLTRDNQPYLRPEEAAGKPADELTDIYRLGALMYHMLVGTPPVAPRAARMFTTAGKLIPPPPPPSVHAVRHDISSQLDAAITRALSLEPADRFTKASQLAEILEDSQAHRQDHSPHSYRPSQAAIVDSFEYGEEEKRWERKRRQQARGRLLVLLVLLGAAIAGYVFMQS